VQSEQFKKVVSLLQRLEWDAARAAAMLISSDFVREMAQVLIERSRPIVQRS
jgi:hypothetical protein